MIVLARAEADGAPDTYGILDVDVVRNGFGAQRESFEADVTLTLDWQGAGFGDQDSEREDAETLIVNGVLIRAPRVQRVGDDVTVIATLKDEPVAVQQGPIVACTWHPELNEDSPLHAWFVRMAELSSAAARVAVSPS
jgi:5'-phosphate synthase pdxT subunit